MLFNEVLLSHIRPSVQSNDQLAQAMTLLARKFPQLNPATRIDYVPYHEVRIAQAEAFRVTDLPQPVFTPKPGLVAAFQRLRARVHKWFVDHEHHPGDFPKGWKSYDISRIGIQVTYPPGPMVRSSERTLRLEAYGIHFRTLDYGGGQRFQENWYIECAYDGATDTLYIRR